MQNKDEIKELLEVACLDEKTPNNFHAYRYYHHVFSVLSNYKLQVWNWKAFFGSIIWLLSKKMFLNSVYVLAFAVLIFTISNFFVSFKWAVFVTLLFVSIIVGSKGNQLYYQFLRRKRILFYTIKESAQDSLKIKSLMKIASIRQNVLLLPDVSDIYYMTVFRYLDSGEKIFWNWSACLFNIFWLIYRKMYGFALTFISIFAFIYKLKSYCDMNVQKHILFNAFYPIFYLIDNYTAVLYILFSIAMGCYGNYLYVRQLNRKLRQGYHFLSFKPVDEKTAFLVFFALFFGMEFKNFLDFKWESLQNNFLLIYVVCFIIYVVQKIILHKHLKKFEKIDNPYYEEDEYNEEDYQDIKEETAPKEIIIEEKIIIQEPINKLEAGESEDQGFVSEEQFVRSLHQADVVNMIPKLAEEPLITVEDEEFSEGIEPINAVGDVSEDELVSMLSDTKINTISEEDTLK